MAALFPYTTLFRSVRRRGDHGHPAGCRAVAAAGGGDAGADRHRHHQQQDRKSTRLNSSHMSISYAVFCLKKKNDAADAALPLERRGRAPDEGHVLLALPLFFVKSPPPPHGCALSLHDALPICASAG